MNGRRMLYAIGVFVLTVFVPVSTWAQSSFSAGVGVNFFRYETTYLTALSATYQHELQEGLELNIGGDFNITTKENKNDDIKPRFVIPANIGLNFTFPQEMVTFLFGTGLTPVFNINTDLEEEEQFHFYMGPYLKGAMRVKVHPIMSWFVEYQQDLLIGGDDWINSSSRVLTGINFAFVRRSGA